MNTLSNTQVLIDKGKKFFVPVYGPKDTILDHGKGAKVWDTNGKEYIDLGSGIAVNNLGHANEKLIEVANKQLNKLWHTSNVWYNEPSIELAEKLLQNSFADQVFFTNSGAESNEGAIKFARKHTSSQIDSGKNEIISFRGSFHGRTIATITATAQEKYQQGFGPLPENFHYSQFGDFEAIERIISDRTSAVIIEPIQGEGGVKVPPIGFLKHIRNLCDQYQALLIFDEVQCGIGRTGKLFAYEWENVTPDILTLAKGLGCGMPIGAILCNEKVSQSLQKGDHGSTFGGGPFVTAVAKEALSQICEETFLTKVIEKGNQFTAFLNSLNKELKLFREIRGKGLMIGAELNENYTGKAADFVSAGKEKGVLFLQAGADVLRFLPPLNISNEELKDGLSRIKKTFTDLG